MSLQATLRERSNDPARCQHGYLLTWKNCPGCKSDGIVLRHGTLRRIVYQAIQAHIYEARRDGCQECGGPLKLDNLALTDEVLAAIRGGDDA